MNGRCGRRGFLKSLALATAGLAAPRWLAAAATTPRLPNIVYIMADDMGYGDVGCYGAKKIRTPHVDQLADEGIRFTDAHTPSAVCTPTRYGVLTGRYCWRSPLKEGVLWSGYEPLLIEPGRMTVASMLKAKGYATASVGKWHLGFGREKPDKQYSGLLEPGPLACGFDYSFQVPASHDMAPYCFVENGRVLGELTEEKAPRHFQQRAGLMTKGWDDSQIGPTLAAKAVAFIERHAKAGNDRPFYLYFTPVAPHRPNVVADFMKGKSQAGERGDHVQEFDWAVGEVVQALARLGLADDTLVIVTSDNGARPVGRDGYEWVDGKMKGIKTLFDHKSCGDLRGYKAEIYDGGHRVPFVARWPGRIRPGTVSDEVICLTDHLATCAAIAGAELPDGAAEDSFNVLPALLGEKRSKPIREATVHHDIQGRFSIRQGPWKLVMPQSLWHRPEMKRAGAKSDRVYAPELYNVVEDLGEKNDVADQHPDVVARLARLLEKYQTDGRSRPPRQRGA